MAKGTNNVLQNIIQKAKDRETRNPTKTRDGRMCYGTVSSSYSTRGIRRVPLPTNPEFGEFCCDHYVIFIVAIVLSVHLGITNSDYPFSILKLFFVNVWRKNIFDIYVTEYGTALTTILPILFLYLNTVTVTTGTFEPWWEREVWRLKIWFNPPFL